VLTVTGAGTLVLDANQAGNSNYYAAAQVQQTLVVTPASQSISFTAPASPLTFTANETVSLQATGGASGNPVTFSIDPSSTGSGSINGAVLTVTGAGTIVLDANQAGNSNYNAAPQVQQSLVVNPVSSIAGPTLGVPGQPLTYTFAVNGATQGLTFTITYGDGSRLTTRAAGPTITLDHLYTVPGRFLIQVTAADQAGVVSQPATQTVTISTVALEPDPSGGTTLAVGGTPGNDVILLSPADTTGDINVNYNGTTLGNFKPSGHILVYGQSGNDIIQLKSNKIGTTTYYITVPAFLYGGATGNDILDARGSRANNVLTGGGGRNLLYGGQGRDLLIAGRGASLLIAGSGDDILMGGWTNYDLSSSTTTYDKKLAALEAIMAEWGSADSYTTRVNDLESGGGLNGAALLNASTVHDNALVDMLLGTPGSGFDWFLAGPTDRVMLKKTGEVQTTIS
jgi:hypothetical protein